MRFLVIGLAVLTATGVFAKNHELASDWAKGDKMKQVVESYFEAFNRHDIEAMVDLYAEDARLESPEDPFLIIGKEGIKKHYSEFFGMIPDVKDEVKNIVVGEDKVAVEFVSTGTIPSESGEPQKFELKIATIFEFKGGKITRDATYYDTAVTN